MASGAAEALGRDAPQRTVSISASRGFAGMALRTGPATLIRSLAFRPRRNGFSHFPTNRRGRSRRHRVNLCKWRRGTAAEGRPPPGTVPLRTRRSKITEPFLSTQASE